MGTKGKRPLRSQNIQNPEPDLIVGVDSIIKNAVDNRYLDDKGNLLLDKIAEKYNIAVKYEDLPSSESGYIKSEDGIYTIGINRKHNPRRQRFTFAHELGHYFLHRSDGSGDTIYRDEIFFRIENSSSIEYAANEFASRLLIPEDRLENKLREGMCDIKDLADYFNVSAPAMKYRIISLGYTISDD